MGRGFYKQKGPGLPRPFAACRYRMLLDGDLFALRSRLLRQSKLEHAVVELRLGLGLVKLLRQREAAAHLAVDALRMKHTLFLRLLLALHFGGERDLRAVDGYLDVFLLDAR